MEQGSLEALKKNHWIEDIRTIEFSNTPGSLTAKSFPYLVGGWTNPFEKYARQIGSFPQGSGWK